MNFGTTFLHDNRIEFNFWAPDSKIVDLCVKNKNSDISFELPMTPENNGWFSLITDHVKSGANYQFRLEDGMLVPDPASRYQLEDVHGASIVINPDEFNWEDDNFWKGRTWEEAVIYEIHTGAFTKEGTFNAIIEKLDYLKSLGITAIQLMPVADFPGKRNWGYDGVLPFAPDNTYGTPDDLKNLIKTAHQKGLMVFLDVVYNHFGPEGNYLHVYARSKFFNSKEKTPWGDSLNFKNEDVRNFFIQNALYWLQEYHFDGLRFDAVHAINDNSKTHILKEIATKVKASTKNRHVHLILENDNNEAKYLKNDNGNYTAQWNDDFHHAMYVLLTGKKSGYYEDFSDEKTPHKPVYYLAKSLAEGFAYQGEKSFHRGGINRGGNSKNLLTASFINFLQNHDQIGNEYLSQRINKLISSDALKAAACIYLLSPAIPMVFMGEEFGCEEPFFFFCDFEKNLAKSVNEGRLKELSKFSEVTDKNILTKIPDVTSKEAFVESKINWKQNSTNNHEEFFDFYKKILEIRKKYIIPIITELIHKETGFEIISDSVFFIRWKSKNGKFLELLANLSDKPQACDMHFSGELIAESKQGSFKQFKEQKTIPNWGVFWTLN